MEDCAFNKMFSRRSAVCYLVITMMFFFSILRLTGVAVSDYGAVQKVQSSYRLPVVKLRGTVYDRRGKPLTNAQSKTVAAVSPTPRGITAISGLKSGEELTQVLERLKNGKPVLCGLPEKTESDGIVCLSVPQHETAETPAIHLLGTVNAEGHGVSGIEKAYDGLLYSGETVSVVYTVNGTGKLLEGIPPEIEYNQSALHDGVITTLDADIQTIAEKAANRLEVGAVLVADAADSQILAAVSRPTYDPTDLEPYLNHPDSPFLNRVISAYRVGSVFKPCVAATGLERGCGGYTYTCTGKCRIIDRYFRCHKSDGHGSMNLQSGLANSCNTFFYHFALQSGADAILSMASALNFGRAFSLCDGLETASGGLPEAETLSNPSLLANFSIGQGELSLSPAVMLNLYAAIASDGGYYLPTVVRGTLENGEFKAAKKAEKTRVMSKETAKTLREYLQTVVTEGTGVSALPTSVSAAGKTATAQTGQYRDGAEICEGWFCGFFPAEEPKYIVIVFSQDTKRQSATCAHIFAEIANQITALRG